MIREPAPFLTLSRNAAARFLQTVVVVDDEAIYREAVPDDTAGSANLSPGDPATRQEAPADALPDARGTSPAEVVPEAAPTLVAPGASDLRAAVDDEIDSHELDAKAVTDGFAEHGLVCAVLKPGPTEAVFTASRNAMARADIVVLDWVFHSDYGNQAIEVIRGVLTADVKRLRLIAIYTGQGNLRPVADRTARLLDEHFAEHTLIRPDSFTTQKGPARIAVFAKPKARIPPLDTEVTSRVTTSAALPGRLIDEFAAMTSGLVTHVAVASFSALRENTHRILHRLQPQLDPGYLWHRATQVYPDDAEGHLASVVAAEIRGVLEDENVGAQADMTAIESWLTTYIPADDYQERFGLAAVASRLDAIQLLGQGTGGPNKGETRAKFNTLEPRGRTEDQRCFATDTPSNIRAHEEFAMLLSLRSHYGSPVPVLTLGTLLMTNEENGAVTYWLCVQPACDSVRLTGPTAFPQLPLEPAQQRGEFHLVVRVGNATIRLRLISKPSRLRMEHFEVTDTVHGVVCASAEDNLPVFVSVSGRTYRWLADLKAEHALWMGNELVTALARIGLIESEWLRRWKPR